MERLLYNNVIAGEAVVGADSAACGEGPRSPMMTVSGIAAEGLSADLNIRRIAAECVCPQFTAVLGADTEYRLEVIPVIVLKCRN